MKSLFREGKHYKATFTQCETPSREPDFISRNGCGHVSSKYWYQDGGCYRESDHWGKVGKSIFRFNVICTSVESGCFIPKPLTVTGFCKKSGFKVNREYYFRESFFNENLKANTLRYKRSSIGHIVRRINWHKRYLLALEQNRSLLVLAAKDVFDVILWSEGIVTLKNRKISDVKKLIQSNCLDNIYKGLMIAKSQDYLKYPLLSHKKETGFMKLYKLISNI